MVRWARRGATRLGCLFALLLLVAVAYFGRDVAPIYVHYYQFRDAMTQQANFAQAHTDADIAGRLQALADSLGLPDPAGAVQIQRTDAGISISSTYSEPVDLPGYSTHITFTPHAERTF
ncbi:MAG: hypothetical protein ACREOJ_06280 [Gemmatimonadaceae bacterium]